MKKIFCPSQYVHLAIVATISLFILQSCCCLPESGSASKSKYCDCGKKNVASKQGKKEINKTGDAKVIAESGSPANNTKVEPIKTEQSPEPIAAVAVSNQVQPPVIVTVKTSGKKQGPYFKVKKLPLGIKGMNTHIIAGPCLSFKSSKEDYGNVDHKHKAGAGYQFGIKSTFMFSKRLNVSTALILKNNRASEVLNYSTPGDPGGGGSSSQQESKYSYTYLSAPVLAEVKLGEHFTAMAGPEINLLLGANVRTSGYGTPEKTDIKDNSVKVGAGIQAGIKYEIPKSPVAVQLTYDQRISRLNEKSSSDYSPGGNYDTPAWNMKSIQLSLTCAICQLLKNLGGKN